MNAKDENKQCPHCHSTNTRRTGTTPVQEKDRSRGKGWVYYIKTHWACFSCWRQFTTSKIVSQAQYGEAFK